MFGGFTVKKRSTIIILKDANNSIERKGVNLFGDCLNSVFTTDKSHGLYGLFITTD